MTQEAVVEEVVTKPLVVKEIPLEDRKIQFVFGRIDEIGADALVCPQDPKFRGSTQEAELLKIKYGADPFSEAQEMYTERMMGSRRIGERGIRDLPSGFARVTEVGANKLGVRKIVHVVVESSGNGAEVEEAARSALLSASLDSEVKTVAIPLMGEITAYSLRGNIPAAVRGIEGHFRLTPQSTIENVFLVVNADDTPANRSQIEEMISK